MGTLEGWGLDLWDLLTVLFYVVIFLLPGVLFLVSLRGLLASISESSRALAPNTVWLHLIPGFNLGWFLYTVVKVRDSLKKEFLLRGWPDHGDSGYRMGLTTGILLICLVALGWVPFVGWLIGLAALVCGGLYWIRVAVLRRRLQEAGPPRLHPISPPPFVGELLAPPAGRAPVADALSDPRSGPTPPASGES